MTVDVPLFVAACGFTGMLSTLVLGLAQRWMAHHRWRLERFRQDNDRRERQIQRLQERVEAMNPITEAKVRSLEALFSPGGITGAIGEAENYDGRPPSLVSELDAWQAEYDRACQMHEARVALRGLGPW